MWFCRCRDRRTNLRHRPARGPQQSRTRVDAAPPRSAPPMRSFGRPPSNVCCPECPLIPKFALEGAARYCELRTRDTSRQHAYHGRATSDLGFDADSAAMQADEGPHQRQAETDAAVSRTERMALKPVENLVLHLGRNARSLVG